jgi:uncharacterized tellurite resistance protein B-like protein
VLFDVAYADGRLSSEEREEIRRIAASLNLSQRQVNDAREQASRPRVDGTAM